MRDGFGASHLPDDCSDINLRQFINEIISLKSPPPTNPSTCCLFVIVNNKLTILWVS